MAAVFDSFDPSSPLAYEPSQTALLLLDFQNVVVHILDDEGIAAVGVAKAMREWALSKNILVMHSILDCETPPREDAKGRDRFPGLLSMIQSDPSAALEVPALAADPGNSNEVVVLKQLGFVSGLKSKGAMDALREQGIRSLVICGLSTSGAALRTALGGADEGFVVTVVEDGCADRVDGLHETLVRHAMPMTSHVCKGEDFVREYQGRQK